MQITIVFPFRNRDGLRVKRSLNSLQSQSNKEFRVLFVDYGSKKTIAQEIETIVSQYDFVKYQYLHTQYQPWNKSKALNFALHQTDTSYFFVADIDMIFRFDFVEKAIALIHNKTNHNVYFKVGFLTESETKLEKEFKEYQINFESNAEATGLTLFTTSLLKSYGGFDEFYHFWGAEDTDVHVRLQNAGHVVFFYGSEILMLHQWHPSYRSLEQNKLTQDLQLSGVVQLNHQHLKQAIQLNRTIIDCFAQNCIMNKYEYQKLQETQDVFVLTNKKNEIDHFLFFTLAQPSSHFVTYRFILDPFFLTKKYKFKRILGKNVPKYYSLKEINDKLLLHIISFYHDLPYIYEISADLKSITFSIYKKEVKQIK